MEPSSIHIEDEHEKAESKTHANSINVPDKKVEKKSYPIAGDDDGEKPEIKTAPVTTDTNNQKLKVKTPAITADDIVVRRRAAHTQDINHKINTNLPTSATSNFDRRTDLAVSTWLPLVSFIHNPTGECSPDILRSSVQPRMIDVAFPTVIIIDDKWIEVRCQHCGANSPLTGKGFFKSLQGFVQHVSRLHARVSTWADVVRHCQERMVSAKDAALLKEGEMANDEPILHDRGRARKRIDEFYTSRMAGTL